MSLPVLIKDKHQLIPQKYLIDLGKLIQKFLQLPTCTYLEAGAYDGVQQSNTLAFRQQLGWGGLLVEPIPKYFELCVKNRPADIVERAMLVEQEGSAPRRIVDHGMMSKLVDSSNKETQFSPSRKIKKLIRMLLKRGGAEHSVDSRTINELACKNNIDEIHFMSLDVKGFEYEALCGADLKSLNTVALLVECRTSMIMKLLELLLCQGYVLAEAVSRFNLQDNPAWDGSHQDYLFLRRDFFAWAGK